MGSPNGGNTGGGGGTGRTDAGPKRTTAYKAGVGNINEKGQKTKTTFTKADDTREDARSTNYTTQPKTSTFKTSKKSFDDAAGKSKLDNYEIKNTGSLVLDSFKIGRQKMFETNRKHFQEKVLTSKNRGGYEDTFDSYSKYVDDRMSGKTDAYGNTIYSNTNNDDPINKVTKTAPTVGDGTSTDQPPTTSETDTETEANRLLKIKKKGRSKSIMTSAKGVTKTSSDYSLGTPSLLGRV